MILKFKAVHSRLCVLCKILPFAVKASLYFPQVVSHPAIIQLQCVYKTVSCKIGDFDGERLGKIYGQSDGNLCASTAARLAIFHWLHRYTKLENTDMWCYAIWHRCCIVSQASKIRVEMKVKRTKLKGVLEIDPPTNFSDFRGEYIEHYNERLYKNAGVKVDFIQDTFSTSYKNVLRGIHGDMKTWKLVTCAFGSFYFVVVNNDKNSEQYKEWEAFSLSAQNKKQILVPPKHGNGHFVTSEIAIFHYKQSTEYDRDSQFTLKWNDRNIGIWWPCSDPILSQRDSQ